MLRNFICWFVLLRKGKRYVVQLAHTHTRRKVAKVIFQYPITPQQQSIGKPTDCSNCCKLYARALPRTVRERASSGVQSQSQRRLERGHIPVDHIESVTARASLYVDGIGKSMRQPSNTRQQQVRTFIHLYSTRAIPLRPEYLQEHIVLHAALSPSHHSLLAKVSECMCM